MEKMEYPPYLNAYGQIPILFKKISDASVPTKFTQDFLTTVLELKSKSHRPMIPFLKRIGFLDQNNVPTPIYSEYKDDEKARFIMARQVKDAYKDIYKAHEYAHRLPKDQIVTKLSSVLGAAKDDQILPTIASTFLELCKLSDFEGDLTALKSKKTENEKFDEPSQNHVTSQTDLTGIKNKLGISYTINLNLPPSTDRKVFDAIFKSLKENLLQ